MPRGSNPNSIAAIAPFKFKKGDDSPRKPKGVQSIGASLRQWIGILAAENEDGSPVYSQSDLMAIANAPDDDKKTSPMKRCAAQRLVSMCKGDKNALANLSVLLDRTEGRPHQSVSHDVGAFQRKRIIVEGVDTSVPVVELAGGIAPALIHQTIDDESDS